jgi:predicted nucleic acid-binding protein
MTILVDSNVLLRGLQPEHPSHSVASAAVSRFLDAGERLWVTSQNIAEFWNVATRPTVNYGLGLSTALARWEVDRIERLMALLPDSPAVYPEWKSLVIKHDVIGTKVHDTRLVAAMNVNGIRRILTFNTADFKRYAVETLHPGEAALP